MTQTELEQQVQKNTTAINGLNTAIGDFATLTQLNSVSDTVDSIQTIIATLQSAVTELQTSIGLINKLSKLLDINIKDDLAKDDLLQFDGDRWTNIKPSEVGITGGDTTVNIGSLTDLSDVAISNLTHGQALVWNGIASRWVNSTINVGSSEPQFDEAAMWRALGGSTSNKKISPTYINGQQLNLTGITVNGSTIVFTNSNNTVTISSGGVNASGNIISQSEITAYA